MSRVEGKVAIVSGGARGIGAATVAALVAEGAKVVIADLLEAEGRALAARLGPAVAYSHLDVADPAEWRKVVKAALAKFGKLNVLVNNAGIGGFGSVSEVTLDDWNRFLPIGAEFVADGGETAGNASLGAR